MVTDEEDKKEKINEIKLGNIQFIGNLFLHNFIPTKIINECIEFLLKKLDDLNILFLSQLLNQISYKLSIEDLNILDKIYSKLENLL